MGFPDKKPALIYDYTKILKYLWPKADILWNEWRLGVLFGRQFFQLSSIIFTIEAKVLHQQNYIEKTGNKTNTNFSNVARDNGEILDIKF